MIPEILIELADFLGNGWVALCICSAGLSLVSIAAAWDLYEKEREAIEG